MHASARLMRLNVQVLQSAKANAVHNHGLDGDRLSVGKHSI